MILKTLKKKQRSDIQTYFDKIGFQKKLTIIDIFRNLLRKLLSFNLGYINSAYTWDFNWLILYLLRFSTQKYFVVLV